ncbi:unnamed protein product [Brassica rapa subsp. trilocularis]
MFSQLGCLKFFSTSWPQVLLLKAAVTIRFPLVRRSSSLKILPHAS